MLALLYLKACLRKTLPRATAQLRKGQHQLQWMVLTCACCFSAVAQAGGGQRVAALVIAHCLLGDHRGYGRLWNLALGQIDIYALRHRGLTGADPFALDREGASRMVDEYAAALVATFESYSPSM